jgi:hypothetical protein
MGKLSLTMAWWAVCSAIFYIVVGASLALTYGARNALIGMVLSVISYGLINACISRYAMRTACRWPCSRASCSAGSGPRWPR